MNLAAIVVVIAVMLAFPTLASAQTGNPAAGSASSPSAKSSDPSGSGTSTSGGKDANDDQGRDKMGTTGRARPQNDSTTSEPAQKNMTGQQKAGTNAEGNAKP